jgi:hypothetical protein
VDDDDDDDDHHHHHHDLDGEGPFACASSKMQTKAT